MSRPSTSTGVMAVVSTLVFQWSIVSGAPAATTGKKIVAGKPSRMLRSHVKWNKRGRIVGLIRNCPGCEVKALNAKRKVVKSCTVKPGGKSYELEWLHPGTYTLLITADGYEALDVHKLSVRAKSDLRVDVEF